QLPAQLNVYPLLLQDAGYRIGHGGKSYGPGSLDNRDQHPAGPGFGPGINGLANFLDEQPNNTPFCYWLGSHDPHRPYDHNAGQDAGIDPDRVHLFSHFPDTPAVRNDIADYYSEVQRFDRLVANALNQLEQRGILDDTLIVVTGDHGMPFPRCKGNLYDAGTRVPLVVRFPGGVGAPGSATDALVSLTDLAPTFLDAAGLTAPDDMTGRSLLPILAATDDADVEWRESIVFGRERHTSCREAPITGGYPSRAIRTDRWLYIQNLEPTRWPAGTPHPDRALPLPHRNNIRGWLGDCDNGPAKFVVYTHRNTPGYEQYWQLCFAKRPAEELYDLYNDPDALNNLAAPEHAAEYQDITHTLRDNLTAYLLSTADPRALPDGDTTDFEQDPYTGGTNTRPGNETLDRYAP
ncbi:MAG: sulfatase, partial [Phycisphaerales bacterium JB063]